MRKLKKKADEFIKANHQEFGLCGTNTPHNEPKYPPLGTGHMSTGWSKNSHFRWGYNGRWNNYRRSSTCMYFTNYQKQPNTGSVLSLDRSLVDIAEQIQNDSDSRIVVVNRGRLEDYAFVEACKEAGLPKLTQIILAYDGHVNYTFDPSVKFEFVDIIPSRLRDTAEMIIPWLRTSSLDVIQDIAIARRCSDRDTRLVYPTRMKFINHNHDGEEAVGPANWALCDAEEDTALMRFDWFSTDWHKMRTVPNLGTWSPELMASQLNDSHLKACLSTNDSANADLATTNMWRSVSPLADSFHDLPDWWEAMEEEIEALHDGGKHNEKWFTPLYRLAKILGVAYPMTDDTYGVVL